MRKLRLRKGTGPSSRSQGTFPAEAGLEARLPPDGNTLFSIHPAGSHPWPPTTGSSLSRSCIPDGPPPCSLPLLPPPEELREHSHIFLASAKPRRIRKMKPFLGKPLYIRERNCGECGETETPGPHLRRLPGHLQLTHCCTAMLAGPAGSSGSSMEARWLFNASAHSLGQMGRFWE